MGICRYGTTITGRTSLFLNYLSFKDLAILENGTQGHMIFNFGEYFNSNLNRRMVGVYNTSIGEMDLVLGVDKRIYQAVDEIKNDGYKNLLLLPSAIGDVMGIDLNYYAMDLKDNYEINAFTPRIKSDADFYEGEEAFFNSLLDLITDEPSKDKSGVSIIGDLNTYINFKKHQEIEKLLNKHFGVETVFDSLRKNNLNDVNKIINSKLIIVTSKSALALALDLNKYFKIPYYYFNSIDLEHIKLDLVEISKLLNISNNIEYEDEHFEGVFFQFQNIINFNKDKKIVLYLNTDDLDSIIKMFKLMDIEVEAICTHKDKVYKHQSVDEFMDDHLNKNEIIIASDLIKHYIPSSIALENSGLYYHLLTPNIVPFTLEKGFYKLAELISNELIKE